MVGKANEMNLVTHIDNIKFFPTQTKGQERGWQLDRLPCNGVFITSLQADGPRKKSLVFNNSPVK